MTKKKNSEFNLVRVFAAGLALIILLAGGLYYRRYAANEALLRQEQEQKEAALRSRENFIKTVAPLAQKAAKPYGLFPSVTIAQACLESNYGQSALARQYNNLFGVKGSDPNTTKLLSTKEYENGRWVEVTGRFQVYDSYSSAIQAHAQLLANGTSWNRSQYQHVLQAKTWRQQAQALYRDGYATDPNYPAKLIDLIEQYHLDKYDN
jgi:flagellum-specific peptidoglycan hydrolase FlgJ